jgi:predicted TIM-barrel fold metal-dependent hydrolase
VIVDAHVHLFPDRLIEAVRAWFDQHAWNIRYRETADDCVARLLAGGVDRMVALPYAHKPGMARALNDFTLQMAARHPSVVPCCTVFPGEPGEEQLLEEALGSAPRAGQRGSTGPFHGIKIHSHVMRIAADDARLDPVWRASARFQKPVVIHCGPEPAAAGYGVDVKSLSGAGRLARALERHPGAIAVVPHLGADQFREFEALLGKFDTLYLDTAMVVGGFFEPLGMPAQLELVGRNPGRILYGTDFPNLPYDWETERRALETLPLDVAAREALFGGTAARVFGIGAGA